MKRTYLGLSSIALALGLSSGAFALPAPSPSPTPAVEAADVPEVLSQMAPPEPTSTPAPQISYRCEDGNSLRFGLETCEYHTSGYFYDDVEYNCEESRFLSTDPANPLVFIYRQKVTISCSVNVRVAFNLIRGATAKYDDGSAPPNNWKECSPRVYYTGPYNNERLLVDLCSSIPTESYKYNSPITQYDATCDQIDEAERWRQAAITDFQLRYTGGTLADPFVVPGSDTVGGGNVSLSVKRSVSFQAPCCASAP